MKAERTSVIIIGAGPVGLAMAARLTLQHIPFTVIEKGPTVGWNMMHWGHVSLFSTWSESLDARSLSLLQQKGINFSVPEGYPSGKDLVQQYLLPLAEAIGREKLMLETAVTSVMYQSTSQTFAVRFKHGHTPGTLISPIVIDASGTWGHFNRLVEDRSLPAGYLYSGIPDRTFVADLPCNATVAVVGNGHSAMNSLVELTTNSNHTLTWLLREAAPRFGISKVGGRSEALERKMKALIEHQRVKVIPNFTVRAIELKDDRVTVVSHTHQLLPNIRVVVSNIGSFPDYSFVEGFELVRDEQYWTAPRLAPRINPRLHSCDSLSYRFSDTILTDVRYYVVGMKSFGKASNFLLSKGYEILDELTQLLTSEQIL